MACEALTEQPRSSAPVNQSRRLFFHHLIFPGAFIQLGKGKASPQVLCAHTTRASPTGIVFMAVFLAVSMAVFLAVFIDVFSSLSQ